MNNLPEGTRGKILAIGILLLFAAIVHLVIVGPLIDVYDGGRQTLQERSDMAQRLGVSARDLPRLRSEVEQSHQQPQDDKLLIEGSSATVAAATLQSTMKQLVESGGAKLSSAEILPPETRDQFQRVGIHVSFGGDLTLLMSVLRGIETAHPAIFVDNVEIRGAGDAAQDGGGQALSITFDLYGFRLL